MVKDEKETVVIEVVKEEDQDGDPWSSNQSLNTVMRWVWTAARIVSKFEP